MTEELPTSPRAYYCRRCHRNLLGGIQVRLNMRMRPGWHQYRHCTRPVETSPADDPGRKCNFWHVEWIFMQGDDCWSLHLGFFNGRNVAAEFVNLRPEGPLPEEWHPADRSA